MDTHRQMDRSDLSGIRLALTSPCICTSFKTENAHLVGSLKPSEVPAPGPGEGRASGRPPGWTTRFGCANAWPLPKRKEILSQLPQRFVGLLSPHLSPTFCRGPSPQCRRSSHCYRLSIFQLPFPLH